MVYPLDRQAVARFLETHREVIVVEELDDFLEQTVKSVAFDNRIMTRITGKENIVDWIGEYTPGRVRELLHRCWPALVTAPPAGPQLQPAPVRFPQLCPGCGHRSAFFAISKALKKSDITVADIGCHTLGYLPPYEIGQLLMSMGASTGIGTGAFTVQPRAARRCVSRRLDLLPRGHSRHNQRTVQ
jgi:indolepyruvate ferredoxin oxidoreductase, alpha subunit